MDTATLRQRFETRVDRSPGHGPAGECHIWTGAKAGNGYGRLRVDGRNIGAHRVAWFLEHEAWPLGGLQVLHAPLVCNTALCVNVNHLRLGTQSDNMFDRVADNANPSSTKTHCPAGHAYDDENTYRFDARRRCRECNRLAVKRYKARSRVGVA